MARRTKSGSIEHTCTVAAARFADAFDAQHGCMLKQCAGVRNQVPSAVHDMRVASRRLRAVLGEYRHILDGEAQAAFTEELRTVTRDLGRPRELDVSLRIAKSARRHAGHAAKPAAKAFVKHLTRLRRGMNNRARAAADLAQSISFKLAAARLRSSARDVDDCWVEISRNRILDQFRDVCKSCLAWRARHDAGELHAVRIMIKKLRYACELRAAYFNDAFSVYIFELKRAQDALGVWNDYRNVIAYLDDFASIAGPELTPGLRQLRKRFVAEGGKQINAFREESKQLFSGKGTARLKRAMSTAVPPCCKITP